MTVEIFDRAKFQDALSVALDGKDLKWQDVGFQGGELHYVIPVYAFNEIDNFVGVEINSTIRKDGLSAGTGEDSIRVWIADADGHPLGNKTQRWVTRVSGWERRLAEVLSKVIEMAGQIGICPTCNNLEKVFIVKKDGPNKGRLFKKCCDVFVWLDEVDDDTPDCPDCGHPMVKRDGMYGEFYGCRQFPACRGTRKLDWKNQKPKPKQEQGFWSKALQEEKAARKKHEDANPEDKKAALTSKLESVLPKDSIKVKSDVDDDFPPSPNQVDIFDWVKNGINGSNGKTLVVEAVAGSGKTWTGVKMLNLVPTDQKVLFVAFNRHIAKELAKRAPAHVRVSTYHSLGFKAVRAAFGNVVVDDRKVNRILDGYFDKFTQGHLYSPVKKIVSLVKANLVGVSREDLQNITNYYGIPTNGDEDDIFQAVRYVMVKVVDMKNVVDFDDMCYFPVYFKLQMDAYDFIFIDEAQDTNKNQIELAMMSCHPETRIVACGDRYQSLYGFRGADVDAIPNLINALKAETLPLSVTYRNPKNIVSLVNNRFPHIPLEAAEWAIEGEIKDVVYGKALVEMEPGDMVLCRNNAPLVRPAFALIRNGVKAVIRGRDIGKGLLSLIRKFEVYDVSDLFLKLDEYANKEVTKLLVAKKNTQAQALQDKVDTVYAIADGCQYVFEVERKIEQVFSDEVEGVVFSTVHKAKGLEADNIYILKPELMPSSHAESDWELQQEDNIVYVAYTRALKKLVFVREMN